MICHSTLEIKLRNQKVDALKNSIIQLSIIKFQNHVYLQSLQLNKIMFL